MTVRTLERARWAVLRRLTPRSKVREAEAATCLAIHSARPHGRPSHRRALRPAPIWGGAAEHYESARRLIGNDSDRRALADLRVTLDQQFADGDYVTTRTTITGRYEGELMGAPPTGREVAFTGLTISRCRAGKIEEEWSWLTP